MSLLAGLRVVEIVDERTADAGRLLAQLGADVIAVEPRAGSPLRSVPPFVDDEPHPDRSLRWWELMVGKRSVALDLDRPDDQATFRRLVDRSDVVIDGEGRRLDALGVGFDDLAADRPSLIWASITPFGRDSERSEVPTTDLTLLAGGGPMWNCGYDDHSIPPIRGAGNQAFRIGGLYGAIGVLVALEHRAETGRGQLVDVSLNAACNVTSEHATYNWLLIEQECVRQTGRHAYYVETAPVQVRCADGKYATTGVLPRMPAEFGELHSWLDELGLLGDFPEAVFLEMAAKRDEPVDVGSAGEDDEMTAMLSAAREAISAIASSLPAMQFFLESQRRGFPAGAILAPEEAFEDEHFRARGFPVAVDHPEMGRTVRYPGAPYVFSDAAPSTPRRPPLVGEHSAELVADLDRLDDPDDG